MYFEKGDYGFVRVGKHRVSFSSKVDDTAHKFRLSIPGGRGSPVLDGTFTLRDRALHFEGDRGGTSFSLDMTREFPR